MSVGDQWLQVEVEKLIMDQYQTPNWRDSSGLWRSRVWLTLSDQESAQSAYSQSRLGATSSSSFLLISNKLPRQIPPESFPTQAPTARALALSSGDG